MIKNPLATNERCEAHKADVCIISDTDRVVQSLYLAFIYEHKKFIFLKCFQGHIHLFFAVNLLLFVLLRRTPRGIDA